MVLNALKVPTPLSDKSLGKYHINTQNNFFNPRVLKLVNLKKIKKEGMTLDQLGKALSAFPIKIKIVHGGTITLSQFRKTAINTINSGKSFIIVNL